jgi:hypothetical protein
MKRKDCKEDDDPKAEFETTGAEYRVGWQIERFEG